MPRKYTLVAIAYDFDGTLARGNIQENSFLPELNITKQAFWDEVKQLCKDNDMDEILAYMFLLIQKANAQNVKFDKTSLQKHGKKVTYFDGVEAFFPRINRYAKAKQILLKHYIISSGTKEMLLGTSISKFFKYIYASTFKYDQHGVPEWPALAINYTTKTQYLFRINKGIANAWDNSKINAFMREEERPVPFKHMIYIGDGLTDVPAMKMVNYQGGHSIGVYDKSKKNGKNKVREILQGKRASYIAAADYRENSDIDKIVKAIIDQIAAHVSITKYAQ